MAKKKEKEGEEEEEDEEVDEKNGVSIKRELAQCALKFGNRDVTASHLWTKHR